ncbi:MAG TPA: polyphosphate kinase 1 [Abditibacterium sp.]|jgi:polyphosphate kinase
MPETSSTSTKSARRAPARVKKAPPVASKPARAISNLDAPQWYVHRELSWLEFNQRVLEEAYDAENPPLERLKFLAIVAANLDEFFEIRVAGLQQQAETRPYDSGPDGLTASQALDAIAARVRRMVGDQYKCYRSQVVPALAASGIDLLTVDDLDERSRKWAQSYFEREVFPVLTPLAVDPAHPFPQLGNKSLNLVVELRVANREGEIDGMLRDENHVEFRLGVVQVPRVLPRLVEIPAEFAPDHRKIHVFLSSLISAYVGQLFPGLEVRGCYAFRVTRNSELYLDEDEADNLLEAMQEQLAHRKRGDAVRLEVQRGCDPVVVALLLRTFELDPIDLYEVDGPINLTRLMAIYGAEMRPDLKDAPFSPVTPPQLPSSLRPDEFFAVLRSQDVLLHHPYDSFRTVTRFIQMAADDPNVLAIKMTLYRTSKDSPIVKALMRAAEGGKQVTALVELKARFDEENNITWARAMEASGVHVVYGLVGLKTHSKLGFVVRREDDGIRRYVHLGTGNYNEVTARIYTDIGLLTANEEIGEDASKIFNLLTGMSQFPGLKRLMMAPFGLDKEFIRRIERETALAKKAARAKNGEATSARIIVKMNSLVDPSLIQALYRASQAGVQVDLIVRGICCLRPGIPGLSDHIRVRSIIGRFLEHSRVFYFHNGGDEEILCGSADWMPRNFFRRVEIIYPVLDPQLRNRLKHEILLGALADNTKAREILPDGTHVRIKRAPGEPRIGFQGTLLARQKAAAPRALSAPGALQLTPRLIPQILGDAIDGLPGTGADPVLQSLQQSLQKQILGAPLHLQIEGSADESEAAARDSTADTDSAPESDPGQSEPMQIDEHHEE